MLYGCGCICADALVHGYVRGRVCVFPRMCLSLWVSVVNVSLQPTQVHAGICNLPVPV